MALTSFPKSILLKQKSSDHSFFSYKDGTVFPESELGAFNALAKIEVERAKVDSDYVHLRFTHNNKYWSKKDGFIVAESTKPEEDIKKSTCTMFKATDTAEADIFQLVHVQSGFFVQTGTSQVEVKKEGNENSLLRFVDSETIVKLPNRLALKSNNGKFLKSVDDSYHSLDFASDDPNATKSGLEIQALPSGEIRVKSVYYKQFWKRANDGDQTVYAVAGEKETGNKDTLFWPVKISEKTIALRCVANGKYCSRNRMYYDYLHAAADTMVDEARFEVKELVSERKIYDVEYRVDEARIYDSEPLTAGSATLKNEGEKEALLSDKVVYEETATYAVTRSESVTAGLEFTFEGSLTKVVSFKLEMSREVSEKMEWEVSKSEKTTQEATVSALVPARSSVKISYAGSKGKYSVPFSYTQRDIDSTTGKITITKHNDGIYHGQGSLDLQFVAAAPVPLPT